jgi:hypothetical protein
MFTRKAMKNESWFLEVKPKLKSQYTRYVEDYREYLKLRGYGEHVNDWFFVKRGFLECWFEPGYHHFWQLWNPGIGYFTYRLYRRLGGKGLGTRGRQNQNIILTFLVNGIVHNLIVMIFMWKLSIPLPFTFLAFGVFTVLFRELGRIVDFSTWPKLIHFAINTGLVIISFNFGFRMDDLLHVIIFQ